RLVPALMVLATAGASLRAQQPAPFTGLYRMFQAGAEVGREQFRRSPGLAQMSVVVPLLGLKLDSRTEFDSTGNFRRFEAQVYNAAGDSLRGSYTVTADGDTLRSVRTTPGGETRVALPGRVAGVIPAQSVAVIALLGRRFSRDTVIRMLPMGGDSTLPVTIVHRGDTAVVTLAGIEARTVIAAGRPGTIEVPMQRVRADLWDGRDSLPPLAGLRRPVPDYRAPAGAPYTATEVVIPIHPAAGDSFSLAGTLTLPAAARGPVPVVVTITGSGRQTRDEDLWPLLPAYRPFREIAERLGAEGIGVLRLDDRGVGGSGGGEGTTADYADDVRQVVAWLRHRPGVAARRLALLGHSEGGAIAPLVAAQDSGLAGIVLLAGPGKTGRAILVDQLRRPIETAPGLSDSGRAAQLAGVPQAVEQIVQSSRWMRWFGDYDPLATARRVTVPVLILQGALDRQVSAGQADTLAAALRAAGNRDVTEKVYPGLNHLFLRSAGDGSPSEYPTLPDTKLPAQVLDDLAVWLRMKLTVPGH
ncbi:MAG TPA: alpha/beta fold hydrolase, partial [Frankiaceae bacterium]|nr:alpha/beta fold hydrolase [Frankiaceae bacterium]